MVPSKSVKKMNLGEVERAGRERGEEPILRGGWGWWETEKLRDLEDGSWESWSGESRP